MKHRRHHPIIGFGPTSVGRLMVLALGVMLSSCAAPGRRPAVPEGLADRAVILGMAAVRTWSDELSEEFLAELERAAKRELDVRQAAGETGPLPRADYLAISGGGANGAYGAGLLCGWTASGTRPEFKLVTGISTGGADRALRLPRSQVRRAA